MVVPSNVDIATTEALSMAQEVDPDGDRTIGKKRGNPEKGRWLHSGEMCLESKWLFLGPRTGRGAGSQQMRTDEVPGLGPAESRCCGPR